MKLFDFGAFQKNMHMASREKYIFHILFGAVHGTPRINLRDVEVDAIFIFLTVRKKFIVYNLKWVQIADQKPRLEPSVKEFQNLIPFCTVFGHPHIVHPNRKVSMIPKINMK